jgi:hypothetical protein
MIYHTSTSPQPPRRGAELSTLTHLPLRHSKKEMLRSANEQHPDIELSDIRIM